MQDLDQAMETTSDIRTKLISSISPKKAKEQGKDGPKKQVKTHQFPPAESREVHEEARQT